MGFATDLQSQSRFRVLQRELLSGLKIIQAGHDGSHEGPFFLRGFVNVFDHLAGIDLQVRQ